MRSASARFRDWGCHDLRFYEVGRKDRWKAAALNSSIEALYNSIYLNRVSGYIAVYANSGTLGNNDGNYSSPCRK